MQIDLDTTNTSAAKIFSGYKAAIKDQRADLHKITTYIYTRKIQVYVTKVLARLFRCENIDVNRRHCHKIGDK